jgi:hypothetical protein
VTGVAAIEDCPVCHCPTLQVGVVRWVCLWCGWTDPAHPALDVDVDDDGAAPGVVES